MKEHHADQAALPGRDEQRASRVAFFVAGFGSAAWAALVPYAKAHAAINDGSLGLLLLCLGIGSTVTMPFSGVLASRFGCRAVIVVAAVILASSLPLLATSSALPLLAVTLIVFGAGLGAMDVAMNIQAIVVEAASGRSMMSGFHGFFSVGGAVGAGVMAALLSVGKSPLVAAGSMSIVICAAVVVAFPNLLPYGIKSDGPALALPRGIVLIIGVFCFVLFLTEGAILDWSALFLTTVRHLEASNAGLGYAAFATAMTIGRLTGDRVVERLGPERVVLLGSLCAAGGFVLTIASPSSLVAFAGFALVGIGCANIVPVLFSAAGRQRDMAPSIAVPAITTIGYAGILTGPAAIGFVSQLANLSTAFLALAAMLVAVALGARVLRRVERAARA